MEGKACCLGRKSTKLSTFWKIANIFISVDNDTINNSERYFTCGVINLENLGHEILVILLFFLKYGHLKTKFPLRLFIVSLSTETKTQQLNSFQKKY